MKFDVWNEPVPEKVLPHVRQETLTKTDRATPEVVAIVMRAMHKSQDWWEKHWQRSHENVRREGADWVGESTSLRYVVELNTFDELLALMHDGESVRITKLDYYGDGAMGLDFDHECESEKAEVQP